jgi:hypothetical protein
MCLKGEERSVPPPVRGLQTLVYQPVIMATPTAQREEVAEGEVLNI